MQFFTYCKQLCYVIIRTAWILCGHVRGRAGASGGGNHRINSVVQNKTKQKLQFFFVFCFVLYFLTSTCHFYCQEQGVSKEKKAHIVTKLNASAASVMFCNNEIVLDKKNDKCFWASLIFYLLFLAVLFLTPD